MAPLKYICGWHGEPCVQIVISGGVAEAMQRFSLQVALFLMH